mmetsp:Transcript_58855/g.117754  ORF Transcript_58855/g.117754 Transcript_58855/m.117754 type:complete len:103 (-) Transcript_58855:141-449(-)
MAPARRSSLAVIAALALALCVAGPAFLPSATGGAAAPRAAVSSAAAPMGVALGAAAPFALVEPAFAVEGDGTISGFEWAGYVTLALVVFVFYSAQKGNNEGK